METKLEKQVDIPPGLNPNEPGLFLLNEQIYDHGSIEITDDQEKERALAGVLCQGVQYYDFKNVSFINNNGLASLIRILKSSMKNGIKLKFVNVNKRIQIKIKTMGLDKFINCS
ncbi:MAG: STAS domain-containing protein [Bacteroidota bacterium]